MKSVENQQRDKQRDGQGSEHTTVSISIQLPKLNPAKLRWLTSPFRLIWRAMQTITSWIGRHKAWTASSLALVAILAIGGTFGLQTLHHQQTTNTTKKVLGAATAHFSAQQPNFAIVSPKNKPNLAKANGTTSAYDPQRGNYSFQDSLSNYGLIVSEQPVPSKFATATAAVNGIAPTLANSGTSQQAIASSYGLAYVITNPKYNSQTVVAAVKNLIVFIEASHTFSNSDWTTYLDNLQ